MLAQQSFISMTTYQWLYINIAIITIISTAIWKFAIVSSQIDAINDKLILNYEHLQYQSSIAHIELQRQIDTNMFYIKDLPPSWYDSIIRAERNRNRKPQESTNNK